jgi:hypothetical protein
MKSSFKKIKLDFKKLKLDIILLRSSFILYYSSYDSKEVGNDFLVLDLIPF